MKTKRVVALAIAVMSLMMLIPVGVSAFEKDYGYGTKHCGDIFSVFGFGRNAFGFAGAASAASKDGACTGAAANANIGFTGAGANAWAELSDDGTFKASASAGAFLGKLFGNASASVEIKGCDVDFDFDWDCNWPKWPEWHPCKPSCPEKSEPVVTDDPTVEPTGTEPTVEPTTDPELDPVPKMGL